MGNFNSKKSKKSIPSIIKIHWDITQNPQKHLYVIVPNNVNKVNIICPIHLETIKKKIITIKVKYPGNYISYYEIIDKIYDVYRNYKHKITKFKPEKIFFKDIQYINTENNEANYKVLLST